MCVCVCVSVSVSVSVCDRQESDKDSNIFFGELRSVARLYPPFHPGHTDRQLFQMSPAGVESNLCR